VTLGVVTGLAAEARLARPLGLVRAGGGLPDGALAAAEWLVEQGVDGLVSFGLAGGLDPALRPGDLVVPECVRDGDCTYATACELSARLGSRRGILLAGRAAVATAMEKAGLFAQTGAAAIDLESGAVARVAARHAIPFAALRAICDPAGRDLPPASLAAVDRHGGIAILPVLASIARHPRQLPSLVALGRDAIIAYAALKRRVSRPFDPILLGASRHPRRGTVRREAPK
jgi:adenosylhomocysteine nucleosidase